MRASASPHYKAVSIRISFGCGLIIASDHTHPYDITYLTAPVRGGIATIADTYVRSADLLKNKSRPEAAAEGAASWVISEREMREKLKKEREAKERELEKEVRLANGLITIVSANPLFRIGEGKRRGGKQGGGGRGRSREGKGQDG